MFRITADDILINGDIVARIRSATKAYKAIYFYNEEIRKHVAEILAASINKLIDQSKSVRNIADSTGSPTLVCPPPTPEDRKNYGED